MYVHAHASPFLLAERAIAPLGQFPCGSLPRTIETRCTRRDHSQHQLAVVCAIPDGVTVHGTSNDGARRVSMGSKWLPVSAMGEVGEPDHSTRKDAGTSECSALGFGLALHWHRCMLLCIEALGYSLLGTVRL